MKNNGGVLRYKRFADFLEQRNGRMLLTTKLHDRLRMEVWLVGLVTVILEIHLSGDGETLGVDPFIPACFKNDIQKTFDALEKVFDQQNDR